jgi:hypothetical protein
MEKTELCEGGFLLNLPTLPLLKIHIFLVTEHLCCIWVVDTASFHSGWVTAHIYQHFNSSVMQIFFPMYLITFNHVQSKLWFVKQLWARGYWVLFGKTTNDNSFHLQFVT